MCDFCTMIIYYRRVAHSVVTATTASAQTETEGESDESAENDRRNFEGGREG